MHGNTRHPQSWAVIKACELRLVVSPQRQRSRLSSRTRTRSSHPDKPALKRNTEPDFHPTKSCQYLVPFSPQILGKSPLPFFAIKDERHLVFLARLSPKGIDRVGLLAPGERCYDHQTINGELAPGVHLIRSSPYDCGFISDYRDRFIIRKSPRLPKQESTLPETCLTAEAPAPRRNH